MKIMGFESTCDETSVSIVEDGKKILSLSTFSQNDLHEIYGGVVPELACRRHLDLIEPALEQSLAGAGLKLTQIDGFAAAHAPGLIGAILIGLNSAKTLSLIHQKPFFAINHIEAHLYAACMNQKQPSFPALGIVVSGGHTCLVSIDSIGSYQLISTTIDDAIGEAFDKVAKLLNLPYPGGPQVEMLAQKGDANAFAFQSGRVKANPLAFSFSGIKTAVKNCLAANSDRKADIAASFQRAVFDDLLSKAKKALEARSFQSILIGGGVSCNQALQKMLHKLTLPIFLPSKALCLDNAAMIAGLAFHKSPSSLDVHAKPRLAFWDR